MSLKEPTPMMRQNERQHVVNDGGAPDRVSLATQRVAPRRCRCNTNPGGRSCA
jgi:hypothetical protein